MNITVVNTNILIFSQSRDAYKVQHLNISKNAILMSQSLHYSEFNTIKLTVLIELDKYVFIDFL